MDTKTDKIVAQLPVKIRLDKKLMLAGCGGGSLSGKPMMSIHGSSGNKVMILARACVF